MSDVQLITLHHVTDSGRGTLCVAECGRNLPFDVKRVFYLYDMPKGISRGQHAHRTQDQFLICLSGRIELTTVRKGATQSFVLSKPNEGVYFPAKTWVSFSMLEADTICLVMASGLYDEHDYVRNFAAFEALR